MFFSVGEDFVALTCKNVVVIFQSGIRRHTGDFSQEISDRFHPLKFFISSSWNHSVSRSLGPLRASCALNIFWNALFTTFFIAQKVLTMSLVSRTYVWVGGRLKLLISSPTKGALFFLSFFSLGKSKKLGSGRFLELFLYTEMAQYLNFICFAFKRSAFVMSLLPWASSRCSKIQSNLDYPDLSGPQ